MDFLNLRIIQVNRIFFLVILMILSFLTVSMPHNGSEAYAHHSFEMLLKQTVIINKNAIGVKKVCKRVETLLKKLFKFPEALLGATRLFYIRVQVFQTRLNNMVILRLLSLLSAYFHAGKFKHGVKCVIGIGVYNI